MIQNQYQLGTRTIQQTDRKQKEARDVLLRVATHLQGEDCGRNWSDISDILFLAALEARELDLKEMDDEQQIRHESPDHRQPEKRVHPLGHIGGQQRPLPGAEGDESSHRKLPR